MKGHWEAGDLIGRGSSCADDRVDGFKRGPVFPAVFMPLK